MRIISEQNELNMKIKYKKNKPIGLILLTVVISIILFTTGCGPSSKERQTKKEKERKELILKRKEKEKRVISQLATKHNAVYFPPENLDATAFTYELQKFFITHSQKLFIFKGYLEDIEQTKNGIIAEFLCPLGEYYYMTPKTIRFRLTISENSVKQLIKGEREDPMFHSLRYVYGPYYYVVVKVENIMRMKHWVFSLSFN